MWILVQELRSGFDRRTEIIDFPDAMKKARSDGFFMVHLGDSAATCQALSYCDSDIEGISELLWSVEISAE